MKKIVIILLFFSMQNNVFSSECSQLASIALCRDFCDVDVFDDSFLTTHINKEKDGFCYSLVLGKKCENVMIDVALPLSNQQRYVLQEWFTHQDNVYRVVDGGCQVYYCKITSCLWQPKCTISSDDAFIEKLVKERSGDDLPKETINNFKCQKFFILMCLSLMAAYYWNVFA